MGIMPAHSTHTARRGDLCRTTRATAEEVGALTDSTRRWLSDTVRIDAQRHADIALATYEALSNCADHAYRDHAARGTMTLRVSHDGDEGVVRICITDEGRWIDPAIFSTSRGRGVILMRALADDFTIDGRDDGTTVCLHFHHCPSIETR